MIEPNQGLAKHYTHTENQYFDARQYSSGGVLNSGGAA